MIIIRYFTTFGMNTNVIDTMWQYDQAKKIADGLIPYKDFNMITTPLYYWLSAISIKLNRSFISKLIFDDILMIFYYITLYKLSKCFYLSNVKTFAYISLSIMLLNFGYAYNTLSLLFVLIIIYLLYTRTLNNKLLIICGILTGLSVLTKQTIGFFLFVAFCIYLFTENKLNVINFLYYFFSVILIGILFISYLIITKSLYNFFDYCVFGASSFIDNFYLQEYGLGILIFTVLNYSVFIYDKILKKKELFYNKLLLFSVVFLVLSIPIIDFTHNIEVYVISLLYLFMIDDANATYINKLKIFQTPLSLYFLLFSLGLTGHDVIYFKNMKFQNYKYDYIVQEANEIHYIEDIYDKPVMLVDTKYTYLAEFYDVDINNVFNLFLHGNIGTKSAIDWVKGYLESGYIIAVGDLSGITNKTQVCIEVPTWLEDNAELLYHNKETKTYYYAKKE